jgi:glycine hydroxymethyltransferase
VKHSHPHSATGPRLSSRTRAPWPQRLQERSYKLVTGGTDIPLVVVDLRETSITGDRAQASLEPAGLPCNKHPVPGDPRPLEIASGVRFGTSAATTRGLRGKEVAVVAAWIAELLDGLAANGDNAIVEQVIREKVAELADGFPIYTTT